MGEDNNIFENGQARCPSRPGKILMGATPSDMGLHVYMKVMEHNKYARVYNHDIALGAQLNVHWTGG